MFTKVTSFPRICSIEISLIGSVLSSPGGTNQSVSTNALFLETYFRKGDVQFSEESEQTAAGIIYKQTLQISFNSSDANRANRLALAHSTRMIKINLTDGTSYVLGRNDFVQNRRLEVKMSSTLQRSTIEFYCESCTPLTTLEGQLFVNLPGLLPITLM